MLSKKNKILIDTFLIIFGAYALLALLSYDVGILGEYIKNFLLYVFGIGAYIIPFYLFYLSIEIYTFEHPGRFRTWSRIAGITLWFTIFLTVSQWQADQNNFALQSGEFGGWFGKALFSSLIYYLGSSGLFLVLLCLSFFSTFIIGEGRWIRALLSTIKKGLSLSPLWFNQCSTIFLVSAVLIYAP